MADIRKSAMRLRHAFQDGSHPQPEDVAICMWGVELSVRARYPDLALRDAEEIAADAVAALFEATRAERRIDDPAAWLIALARNRAYDRWRALQRTRPHDEPNLAAETPLRGDDAIHRLVDALADRDTVRRAIRAALDVDDGTVVRVVGAWLDHYETTGEVPSIRTVGARAEVPHSTVAKALRRFARYLEAAAPP